MYKSVTKALQEEGYTHLLPKCGSLDEALVQYYCMAEEPKTEWKPIKKGQGGNKHTTTQTRTHTHEHTNTHTHTYPYRWKVRGEVEGDEEESKSVG